MAAHVSHILLSSSRVLLRDAYLLPIRGYIAGPEPPPSYCNRKCLLLVDHVRLLLALIEALLTIGWLTWDNLALIMMAHSKMCIKTGRCCEECVTVFHGTFDA